MKSISWSISHVWLSPFPHQPLGHLFQFSGTQGSHWSEEVVCGGQMCLGTVRIAWREYTLIVFFSWQLFHVEKQVSTANREKHIKQELIKIHLFCLYTYLKAHISKYMIYFVHILYQQSWFGIVWLMVYYSLRFQKWNGNKSFSPIRYVYSGLFRIRVWVWG